MSRPCSVCGNPARREVDAALLAGEPYRDIVARCPGISRSALSRHRAHLLPTDPLPAAEGGWQLVLADPPWDFKAWEESSGNPRLASAHYPTLGADGIAALPVRRVAARDAVLLLWACMPLLPEALRVVRAWGFTYKTVAFTWVKLNQDGAPSTGMGYYTRANAELCLLATRGKGLPRVSRDVPQVIQSRRREHSRKPDGQYDRVERLFGPSVRRLELFARTAWPGWAAWGREVDRFAVPMALLEGAAG